MLCEYAYIRWEISFHISLNHFPILRRSFPNLLPIHLHFRMDATMPLIVEFASKSFGTNFTFIPYIPFVDPSHVLQELPLLKIRCLVTLITRIRTTNFVSNGHVSDKVVVEIEENLALRTFKIDTRNVQHVAQWDIR